MGCRCHFQEIPDEKGKHSDFQGSRPRERAGVLEKGDTDQIDGEGSCQSGEYAQEDVPLGLFRFLLHIACNPGKQGGRQQTQQKTTGGSEEDAQPPSAGEDRKPHHTEQEVDGCTGQCQLCSSEKAGKQDKERLQGDGNRGDRDADVRSDYDEGTEKGGQQDSFLLHAQSLSCT